MSTAAQSSPSSDRSVTTMRRPPARSPPSSTAPIPMPRPCCAHSSRRSPPAATAHHSTWCASPQAIESGTWRSVTWRWWSVWPPPIASRPTKSLPPSSSGSRWSCRSGRSNTPLTAPAIGVDYEARPRARHHRNPAPGAAGTAPGARWAAGHRPDGRLRTGAPRPTDLVDRPLLVALYLLHARTGNGVAQSILDTERAGDHQGSPDLRRGRHQYLTPHRWGAVAALRHGRSRSLAGRVATHGRGGGTSGGD